MNGREQMNYITEIKAFQDFVQIKQLSTGQIALWYSLMYINNKCGWIEWFTVANQMLELNSGLSRQGVLKARNVLKQYGFIDFKSNGTKATSYRIISILESVQASCQVSVQASIQGSVQDSCTLNKLNKTKLNTPITPKSKSNSDSFETFWKSYPRKVAKASALKSWNKIKPSESLVANILKSLSEQIKSDGWQKDNGKYIPHPATWLNGNRWEDEQENNIDSFQENTLITLDMIKIPAESKTRTLEELENLSLEELL